MFAKVPVGIEISGGSLCYHDSQVATLAGLNMQIPAQRWTCILGRSGCGKSSLLRYLAGLLDGKVTWSGELTTEPACDLNHQVAYMAQQDLLMPWLSVLDNVMLSTQFGDQTSIGQQEKALTLLEKVGLVEHAKVFPQQLSGGMRQRVALARTLMQDKPVVLMDEPFSALDAVTRYRLQNLACELLADKTVVLITHDPQEALRLAHQLYIMCGQPAFAESLCLPSSTAPSTSTSSIIPRVFDSECAVLQQTIIDRLEQDYA